MVGRRVLGGAGGSIEAAHPRKPLRRWGGVGSRQNCQPYGGGGQLGSGCQPGGGCQPAGGCGQPGGVANLTGVHPSRRSRRVPFYRTRMQSIPHRQRVHRRFVTPHEQPASRALRREEHLVQMPLEVLRVWSVGPPLGHHDWLASPRVKLLAVSKLVAQSWAHK